MSACAGPRGLIAVRRWKSQPTSDEVLAFDREKCKPLKAAPGIIETAPGAGTLAGVRKLAFQFDLRSPKPKLPGRRPTGFRREVKVTAALPTIPPLPPWAPSWCKKKFTGISSCFIPGPPSGTATGDTEVTRTQYGETRTKFWEIGAGTGDLLAWIQANCGPLAKPSSSFINESFRLKFGLPPGLPKPPPRPNPALPAGAIPFKDNPNAIIERFRGAAPAPAVAGGVPTVPGVWRAGCVRGGVTVSFEYDHPPTAADMAAVNAACGPL